MKNNIDIDSIVDERLLIIETVLKSPAINFYVVGALARDLQLAKRPQSASLRKTNVVIWP